MDPKTRAILLRRLVYIGETAVPGDPDDKYLWREYREISKQLGLKRYSKHKHL